MNNSLYQISEALVVIPTLNEAKTILGCILSLTKNFSGSVVIVDGESTDGTQDIVSALMYKMPQLHLIRNFSRIQSAGINLAVSNCAQSHHRILVRCDAHAQYPPNYVSSLVDTLNQTGATAVGVVMDSYGETPFARAAAYIVDTPIGNGGAAHRGGQKSGWVDHAHHAAIDLAAFRSVGGYDPKFSHNEDAEFDHRLRAAGGKIWLSAGIRIGYEMRRTPGALARQYFYYGQGRAQMLQKHSLRGNLRQQIPIVSLMVQLLSIFLCPLYPGFLLIPTLYWAICLIFGLEALRDPHRCSGILAGFALIIMHYAWATGFLYDKLYPKGYFL